MFDWLFGWSKASKCKKVIKQVQCRLNFLKNKRKAIASQLRKDIALLLKNSYKETALKRLEQLYKDENAIEVYELLCHFSQFILLNLSYIRHHKDMPNHINEAVSSLIFVSARDGDVPQLFLIRKLFGKRYGQRFVDAAIELHPGNLVNREIVEKMSLQSVSEIVKQRMIVEIIRDNFSKSELLALEYKREQEKITEHGHKLSTHVDYQTLSYNPPKQDSCIITSSNSSPGPTSLAINVLSAPVNIQDHKVDHIPLSVRETESPLRLCAATTDMITPEYEEEKPNITSSTSDCSAESTSFESCKEDTIVYLDDVEEFKSSSRKGVNCDQDQRVFVFKPTLGQKKILDYLLFPDEEGRPEKVLYEPGKEMRGPRRSRSTTDNISNNTEVVSLPARKKLRRRSLSQEKRTFPNDVVAAYYGSHRNKKHRKRREKRNHQISVCVDEECRCHSHGKRSSCHCSKEKNPRYFYASGKNDDHGVIIWRKNKPVASDSAAGYKYNYPDDHVAKQGKSDLDVLFPSFRFQDDQITQISRSNSASNSDFEFGTPVPKSNDSNVSCRPLFGKRGESSPPTYSRAMTTVNSQEYNSKENNGTDQFARSISLPIPDNQSSRATTPSSSPSHVHPKLPDYDEIAAKFRALKKARQQK